MDYFDVNKKPQCLLALGVQNFTQLIFLLFAVSGWS